MATTRYPWRFTVLRILPTGWEVIGSVEHARKVDARKQAEAYITEAIKVGRIRAGDATAIVNGYAFERMTAPDRD